MATSSAPVETPAPSPVNPTQPQIPAISAVKSEIPVTEPKEIIPSVSSRPPELSPSVPYTVTIPSYSGWFSWDKIHETERRILPEFFDGKSASRNPSVYKYYRDSIIRRFRGNPSRKIMFTEARRTLVGDVGSIRRVFDFLEAWGLINYTPSGKPSSKEKRAMEEALEKKESPKKVCSNCKAVCSLACFATDKADIILCARCFVRNNYRTGLSSTDFKRVDISEEMRTDWTDKETLHLLEAILQYGEDWKKVAEHVGSRTEKDCVTRFIKLPFGEQFMGGLEVREDGKYHQKKGQISAEPVVENVVEPSLKRRCLTPLADASNPIMAQVAFLSAMVGSKVAGAAAQDAIADLDEVDLANISSANSRKIDSMASKNKEGEAFSVNTDTEILRVAAAEARSQLDKEQQDVEQSISDIVEVQMKEIQEKIIHFEEVELQMEKEWLQLQYMRNLLFADQMTFLQHRARSITSDEVRDKEKELHVTLLD